MTRTRFVLRFVYWWFWCIGRADPCSTEDNPFRSGPIRSFYIARAAAGIEGLGQK